MSTPSQTPSPPVSQPGSEHGTRIVAPPSLNQRSCVTCRRRKVRCDKKRPCTNCIKAGNIQCIYPSPGRAPRRPKNPVAMTERETELLKRLRRLEGMVHEMSGQAEVETVRGSVPGTSAGTSDDKEAKTEATSKPTSTVRVIGMDEGTGTAASWLNKLADLGERPPRAHLLEQDMGRLIIDEGKSRYLSSNFWASLSQEVGDIREIFEDEVCEEDLPTGDDERPHPYVVTEGDHQSFVLGYSSSATSLRSYHPLPSQIPFYWQTFLENVDPLTKIVHVPTMAKTIKEVQNNLDTLSRSTEALMFAIYFSTIVSMSAEDVQQNFGIDKKALLTKYRFAVEQALARAEFLNTSEIVTVQALLVFLIAIRSHDDGRFVFSLTGLAVRLAQGIGLHRDGAIFNLSPFDTEMRRRLWWHIVLLDLRAAEDHGVSCLLNDNMYDTKLPLNINDDDLDPSSTKPPEEKIGATEMTFPLIRFHLSEATRRLKSEPISATGPAHRLSQEEREGLVRQCSKTLEEKYLRYCTRDTPLFWVAATIARLILAKLSLLIYHPFQDPSMVRKLPRETASRLLISSIEVIEYSHLLENEVSTRQWGWLFHTYVQWHAVSYTLAELCMRDYSDPLVERAWAAVDGVFQDWGDAVRHTKNNALWLPMKKLMAKARRRRQEEIAKMSMAQQGQAPLPSGPLGVSLGGKILTYENMPVVCARAKLAMAQAAAAQQASPPTSDSNLQPQDGQPTPVVSHSTISGVSPNVESLGDFMQVEPSLPASFTPSPATIEVTDPSGNIPWIMDDSALVDLDVVDNGVDWESWDDMMRDLQMTGPIESELAQSDSNLGGIGQWWR